MSEASASSDYVRVKHPNGIGVDRVEHVTSLPPASVVQSPVKMVLNKTTTNAAWSSPRTKESFEMQEALLYALDDDVILTKLLHQLKKCCAHILVVYDVYTGVIVAVL